jgi:hypothetical protein
MFEIYNKVVMYKLSEKLKEATEMDLFDLKDMCDNDVN